MATAGKVKATVGGSGGKSSFGLIAKKSSENRRAAGQTNQKTGIVAAKIAQGKKVGKQ